MASADDMEGVILRSGLPGCAMAVDDVDRATLGLAACDELRDSQLYLVIGRVPALFLTMPIPITVFTGFVGAGKTTTILGLLGSLPKGYNACLLKNEFGDVQVDSQLAKQSSLSAVSEILNGCMYVSRHQR